MRSATLPSGCCMANSHACWNTHSLEIVGQCRRPLRDGASLHLAELFRPLFEGLQRHAEREGAVVDVLPVIARVVPTLTGVLCRLSATGTTLASP